MDWRAWISAGALALGGCSLVLQSEGGTEESCDAVTPAGYPPAACVETGPLVVDSTVDSHTISGAFFALQFNVSVAGLAGLSLEELGQALATSPNPGDENEFLAGIAWGNAMSGFEHSVNVVMDAPPMIDASEARASIRFDWVAPTARGITEYTVHPDGRVHRFESVVVANQIDLGVLVAYMGLNPTEFERLHLPNGFLDEFSGVGTPLVTAEVGASLCAESQGGAHIGWTNRGLEGPTVGAGIRATDNYTTAPAVMRVLQSDWVTPFGLVAQDPARFEGTVFIHLGSSAVGEPCAEFGERAAEFAETSGSYDARSGVFITAPPTDEGEVAITLSSDHASPTLAIPNFGDVSPEDLRIRRADVELIEGEDYVQGTDGGTLYVHIATGLHAGDELSIATR